MRQILTTEVDPRAERVIIISRIRQSLKFYAFPK